MSSSGDLFECDSFTSNLEYYQATNDTGDWHFCIQKASITGLYVLEQDALAVSERDGEPGIRSSSDRGQ